MPAPQVFSGGRARFKVDGRQIGYAASVNGEENVEHEPVEVLDLLEVREFVPVAYRVSLNSNMFRVIGNSLKQQGIYPIQDNILTSGTMTCAVEDRLTGKIAAQFFGCRASTKSFDIGARGIVSEACAFVAIRQKDESELS